MGQDIFAVVDYPTSNVQLDRTLNPPGEDAGTRRQNGGAAAVYAGFDRFGRVAQQAWVDDDLAR